MNKQLLGYAIQIGDGQLNQKQQTRKQLNVISFIPKLGLIIAILIALIYPFKTIKAQFVPIPTNSVGPWTSPSNIYQTVALFNCGIGTTAPDGKLEVKFKPCLTPQIGLIVTSVGCTMSERNNIPLTWSMPNSTFQLVDLNGPAPAAIPVTISPVFAFTIPSWSLVKPYEKPLFWIREEDIDNNSQVSNYTTRFIVNPNGNTGINTNSPRGTIDVIQAYKGKKDEPTAIFGKILVGTSIPLMNPEGNGTTPTGVSGNQSCEVMIFNNMRVKNRNRIVQENDQGIIFSDGGNTDGSNLNAGLVIAP